MTFAAPDGTSRTNPNIISENETEEKPWSGIDNTAGVQEQPKLDNEVRHRDKNEGTEAFDAESIASDTRLLRSDTSFVPPPSPPPRLVSLKAAFGNGSEF